MPLVFKASTIKSAIAWIHFHEQLLSGLIWHMKSLLSLNSQI